MEIDPYGSTEGSRIDGTLVSSFVSWDSKVTTVIAMLGGIQDLVRDRMKSDGIYNEFKDVLKVYLISIPVRLKYLLTTMIARVQYGV